jgi:hypothetical protein
MNCKFKIGDIIIDNDGCSYKIIIAKHPYYRGLNINKPIINPVNTYSTYR